MPQATRDDVMDALDAVDADARLGKLGHQEEEKTTERDGVDLVSFIRLMRQRPTHAAGNPHSGPETHSLQVPV